MATNIFDIATKLVALPCPSYVDRLPIRDRIQMTLTGLAAVEPAFTGPKGPLGLWREGTFVLYLDWQSQLGKLTFPLPGWPFPDRSGAAPNRYVDPSKICFSVEGATDAPFVAPLATIGSFVSMRQTKFGNLAGVRQTGFSVNACGARLISRKDPDHTTLSMTVFDALEVVVGVMGPDASLTGIGFQVTLLGEIVELP